MAVSIWIWGGFILFVLAMLALDLGVFNRHAHEVGIREALGLSALWIGLAVVFNVIVYFWQGPRPALEFLTGYLIEKALSIDNLFVFLLLFKYFHVQRQHQHRVLFWGILGAIVLRAIFIFAGVALINRFEWIIYVFGALLIVTAIKMALQGEKEIHPERNPAIRLLKLIMPVTHDNEEGKFLVRRAGRLMATPLLVTVVAVEATDLIFAVDSIPAILAITRDPFIVFTSNIFAIMGLRAIFFALSGLMQLFRHLDMGLCAILLFVGGKMLLSHYFHIPVSVSLGVIVAILTLAILASVVHTRLEARTDK